MLLPMPRQGTFRLSAPWLPQGTFRFSALRLTPALDAVSGAEKLIVPVLSVRLPQGTLRFSALRLTSALDSASGAEKLILPVLSVHRAAGDILAFRAPADPGARLRLRRGKADCPRLERAPCGRGHSGFPRSV